MSLLTVFWTYRAFLRDQDGKEGRPPWTVEELLDYWVANTARYESPRGRW